MMSSSDAQKSAGRDALVGQVLLDRYRIVRRLDDRGAATTYAAQHLLQDRPVAVEVLDTSHARPAAVDRFLEDARTVARVGHENTVQILNGGRTASGSVFLATEPLEGTSLAQTLHSEAPMLWDRAQGIIQQVA